jgi:hypothetical protein
MEIRTGKQQGGRFLAWAALAVIVWAVALITAGAALAGANTDPVYSANDPGAQGGESGENSPTNTPAPCLASWERVPSPNSGSSTNFLNGVAAVPGSDVWVVGNYSPNSGIAQTL